ncbi:Spindle and kinetochore-associated protein 1 [Hondaea fermentalgiana]|uniref:Spindle and kinetochore-associated protein 1 n=1 Tax=Hondaea fermentalgiana TaxID=2315210 RepID=A0A2R5G022_9STRA|nr:Spindle and kinetochore-associated protein 1 [Hondaea fermentalgiana]|eukprot:GBG24362.1 Spindle and kinetochore-associated protein 1 [Hondaea fermentalgiana]
MSLLGEARVASEAFEAVATRLAREVGELQALCLLAGADAQPAALQRLAGAVDGVEARLARLEDNVDAELELAEEAQALAAELAAQAERAEELRRTYKPDPAASENEGDRDEDHHLGADDDVDPQDDNGESEGEEGSAKGPEMCGTVVDAETGEVQVSAPSKEQLAAVPKYMRGRLTVEKVEAAVSVVNAAFAYKRETLAIPRGKQSVSVRDQVLQWRDQELEETRGVQFVSREDVFAQAGREGVDLNVMKSALQVLRYNGALRLVSGGGCARYCVSEEQQT